MNTAPIFLFTMPFLICVLVVNVFFSSENITLTQQAENAAMAGNYFKTEKAYNQLVEAAPLNIEHHRGKIRSHLNIPKKITRNTYRDDTTITAQYTALSQSTDQIKSDIGYYGLVSVYLSNKIVSDY